MKLGLKYSLSFPSSTKLTNLANLILSGFGVGGAFVGMFESPRVASVMIGIGLFIKGLATLSTDSDSLYIKKKDNTKSKNIG